MENKLILGNCIEELDRLSDKSIDLIITDPPYVLDTVGGGFMKKREYKEEIRGISNGFDVEVLDKLVRVMKKINIYIWCSKSQIIDLLDFFVGKHNCNWNLITWHKTNPAPACNNKYLSDTEYCLFFREKGVPIYGSYHTKKTYYVSPLNTKDKKKYNHPTIKPVEYIENFIVNSSSENDIVLDPFMGSGTTGVACKKLNRKFIGMEIDEDYFNTAKQRIGNGE